MSLFIYGTATNTGKDFFTHQDRLDFFLSGHPGNVWVIGNNEKGAVWLASKNGITKTKEEAQAIVDAEITAAQTSWDALPDDEKAPSTRPTDITLPQEFIMSDYNVLHGLKVKYLSSDPSNPEDGQVWYNSSSNTLKVAEVTSATAAGSWASGGAVGTGRTTSSAGTQTANVIMGGQAPPNTSNVEEYNGSSWSEVNNMPYIAPNLGGTGTQTAAIAIGGYYNVSTTAEYDGTNWSSGGSLNTGREIMTGGCGTQTAALAIGGYVREPGAVNKVESYNGSSWSVAPTLNTALYGRAGSGTTSAALAGGGQNGSQSSATEEYNGSSWSTVNARPYGAGSAMASGTQTAALNFGGNPSSNLTTTVSYDGTNWSAEANMATGRAMGGGSPAGTTSSALASTGSSAGTATEEFTVPVSTGVKTLVSS